VNEAVGSEGSIRFRPGERVHAAVLVYEQVDESMRTESTFNFGALADEVDDVPVVPDVPLVLDELVVLLCSSSVPLTSTLWPTCGVSFESSVVSSR